MGLFNLYRIYIKNNIAEIFRNEHYILELNMMSEAYTRVPQKEGDGPQSTFNDAEDHPLVNSVTNDEDDLPCDYRDTFSSTSVGAGHCQQHHSNMIRESALSPTHKFQKI